MISTVIPVYKNTKEFLELFHHNYQFIKNTEIIIVDDASDEQLKEKIEKEYSNVTIIVNEKNCGFAMSTNKGITVAKGEFILLLNSDVKLLDTSFEKSVKEFQDKNLFAQSFIQIEKDGSRVGKNRLYFQRGIFYHSKAADLLKGPNAWAEGGSCLLRREYMAKLKGFSLEYRPFYWEDIDLSYRAKKNGWYVLFNPQIEVEHHHESTIGKYNSKNNIKVTAFKNQFLFTWRNAQLFQLILHIMWLPFNIVYYLLKGEPLFVVGFWKALRNL